MLCIYWTTIIEIAAKEKKEEIWLIPMTKAPTPTEKFKKQRNNIKKRHKKTCKTAHSLLIILSGVPVNTSKDRMQNTL